GQDDAGPGRVGGEANLQPLLAVRPPEPVEDAERDAEPAGSAERIGDLGGARGLTGAEHPAVGDALGPIRQDPPVARREVDTQRGGGFAAVEVGQQEGRHGPILPNRGPPSQSAARARAQNGEPLTHAGTYQIGQAPSGTLTEISMDSSRSSCVPWRSQVTANSPAVADFATRQ